MNAALLKKLLLSIAGISYLYAAFIFAFFYDMTRHITKSLKQIIPGILIIVTGIAINRVLTDPMLLTDVLQIKSGFIKKAICSTIIPLLGASILTIGVTSGLLAIFDKLLYIAFGQRFPYLLTLVITTVLTIGSISSLLIIAEGDQDLTYIAVKTCKEIRESCEVILITAIIVVLIIATIMHIMQSRKKHHKAH